MSYDEVLNLVKSKNAIIKKTQSVNYFVIEDLYNYKLNVMFENKSGTDLLKGVDYIRVNVFGEPYKDKFFVLNNSNIEQFEELREVLKKKYKLIKEPDQLAIDSYNNYAKPILFHFLSNTEPKIIIILELSHIDHTFYEGSVGYLHPKFTEDTLNSIDESVASDDF